MTQMEELPVFVTGVLSGMRVLLVEDAPDNRFLLSRFLRIAGAEVDVAEDGAEALVKADSNLHHAVLMDIQMPVLDGLEATARLRERGFDRPIIALTAHALRAERERSRAAGFDEYLTKPISQAALVMALKRYYESAVTAAPPPSAGP